MSADPRALLAGLARRGLEVVRFGDKIGVRPIRLIEDVDRIAIEWARRELLEALP